MKDNQQLNSLSLSNDEIFLIVNALIEKGRVCANNRKGDRLKGEIWAAAWFERNIKDGMLIKVVIQESESIYDVIRKGKGRWGPPAWSGHDN